MEKITEQIMKLLDESVEDLSKEDYLDVLNDVINDLMIRREAVEDELYDS